MNYKSLKYIGAAGWAFTYICFIVIAAKFEWSMIPLAVCSYNIAYELLYTVLATERGQRIRNGVWFGLDLFIIYNHIGFLHIFCYMGGLNKTISYPFIVTKISYKLPIFLCTLY
jgi:hypothetical protein